MGFGGVRSSVSPRRLDWDMSRTMKVSVMQENKFDRAFLDSMDETLEEVLSAEFRETFYSYLEERLGIKKTTFPSRLDDLVSTLSTIFGSAGSLVLGRAIAKKLCSKLGIPFIEKTGYTLLDYFREAKIKVTALSNP